MKIRFKLLATLVMTAVVAIAGLSVNHVDAFEDYTDIEGETHYGWHLVANETNQAGWEFDEEGNVSYVWAAEGDTSSQRVWNYALRNLAVDGDDEYTISATFTPDPDSDLSVERTYGIVCWYQDADNYLIYWLQQKTDGAYSGQFYGRINGAFRKFYMPQEYQVGACDYQDAWRKGEYYDMWWDQPCTHPSIAYQKSKLLTTEMTLKVISKVEAVTVGGVETTCRRFEMHQIIGESDHTSMVLYVEQLDAESGDFYTGVYSEAFSTGISNFTLECETNFAADVDAKASALPTEINGTDDFAAIVEARNAYEGLLSYQSTCAADTLGKIEAAETAVGAYVDGLILALDDTKSTFKEDVASVYSIFEAMGSLQAHVTKIDELAEAVAKVEDWTDPNQKPSDEPTDEPTDTPVDKPTETPSDEPTETPSDEPTETPSDEPTETPSDEPANKGCGGSVVTSLFGMVALMGTILVVRRKNEE